MKVTWKRYLALILAVALVVTSGAFTSDKFLKATDGEENVVVEESAATPVEEASAEGEEYVVGEEDTQQEVGVVEEMQIQATEEPSADTAAEPASEESEQAASAEEAAQTEETEAEETPAAVVNVVADDGAVISVAAPKGALPEGFTVKAVAVSSETIANTLEGYLENSGRGLVSYKAYDVTIYDKNGNEIQPDSSVKVTIARASGNGDGNITAHLDDAGNIDNVVENGNGTIDTNHFSIIVDAVTSALSTSGSYTVAVGETINISGTSDWVYNHSWTAAPADKVTLSNNSSSKVTVTGSKAGKVTLTHTYYNIYNSKKTETFTVEVTAASATTGNKATITPTIENASVVYFNWHEASDTNNVTLTPITGNTTIDGYTTNTKAGYIVFFAKPDANYLLTGLGASGNNDIYVVGSGQYGNIASYPGLSKVVAAAQAQGYTGMFGFYRAAKETLEASFTVACQSPDMTVAATADKKSDVIPGDNIKFTITITPLTTGSGKDSVTGVEITSLKINGVDVAYTQPQAKNGVYVTTVNYTATEADCGTGLVTLKTSANVSYAGAIAGTAGGSINSSVTLSKEAETNCTIAARKDITYKLEYLNATGLEEYPDEIKAVPYDSTKYYVGQDIEVMSPKYTNATDSKNAGYWTFDGWYYNGAKKTAGQTVKMVKDGVVLTGKWTFTASPRYTVSYSVKKPGENSFTALADSYSKEYPKDTNKNEITKDMPEMADVTVGNLVYKFDGWYTSEDCDTKAPGTGNITSDLTFYGKYNQSNTEYTVNIYTDGNLTGESIVKAAEIGTTITLDQVTAELTAPAGYIIDTANSTASITTVAAASSNVINVYYVKGTYGYTIVYKNGDSTVATDSTHSATYGETVHVTPTAPEGGYTLVSTDTVDLVISDNTRNNVVTFQLYKNVELTANSNRNFTYDGQEHTVSGYTDNSGVSGLVFEGVSASATATNAGTYPVTFSDGAVNTVDSTGKYIVTNVVPGELKIAPLNVTVTIKGHSASRMYNGEALTATGYDVETSSQLLTAADVTGPAQTISASTTDAATVNMGLDEKDFSVSNGNFNVTSITVVDGFVTVTKRNVTLTSPTDSKTYNGTALTNDKVTVGGDGFADGEGATYEVTGSQLTNGSSKNVFTYELNENTKAANYTINTVEGDLTVNKIATEIVIKAGSDSKKYDGSKLKVAENNYTYTDNVLVEGDVLTAVVTGEIGPDVSTGETTVSSYKVMRGNVDVTNCYSFGNSTKGKLEITKRNVTLTSATDSKPYDGKALTNDTVTVSGDGFADGEGATYKVTGSQTTKDSSKNTFTYELNSNTKAGNYNITCTEGDLTVTSSNDEIVVYIQANSSTDNTYDGTAKSVSGYTITSISSSNYSANDIRFVGTVPTLSKIAAGTYTYDLSEDMFANANGNFTNVKFVVTDGSLVINATQNVVKVKSNDNNKTYDGTALTDSGYAVVEGRLAAGDRVVAKVSGSQTDAGSSANTISDVKVLHGEGADAIDVTDSYANLSSESGTLSVKAIEIKLTAKGGSKTYDGTPLTNATVVKTGDEVAEGDTLTYSASGSQLVKGSTKNTLTYELTTDNKSNYIITTEEELLTVNAITAVIEAIPTPNEKVYDGKELTGTATYTSGIVLDGDVITITTKGSQKNVGESKNEIDTVVIKRGDIDVTSCYTIRNGAAAKLTVTAAPVTIKTKDGEKTYDGTPLTNHDADVEGFVEGEGIDITYSGSQLEAGNSANSIEKIEAKSGTLLSNYSIAEPTLGTLTVLPTYAEIKVKANDNEKEYDGDALTDARWTVEGKLVTGDRIVATVTGSQTDAGSSDNTISDVRVLHGEGDNAVDVTRSYANLSSSNGKLVVNPKEITVTSLDGTWVYDGLAHSKQEISYTGLVGENEKIEGKNFATVTTVTSGTDNTFDCEFSGGKASNYSISKAYGKLVITSREVKYQVTVEANSYVGDYDGSSYTASGFKGQDNDGRIPVTVTVGNDSVTYYVSGISSSYTGKHVVDSVSKIDITGTPVVKDAAGNDVTEQFIVNVTNGSFTVNKLNATVSSPDDSKEYDGTPLVNKTVSAKGFLPGEGLKSYEFAATATVTNPGETATNAFTYTIDKDTTDENDYNISYKPGQLSITNRQAKYVIAPTANSGIFTYDGTEKKVSGLVTDTFKAENGLLYTVSGLTAEAALTNAGETTVTVNGTAVVKDASGTDVTSQFSVEPVAGKLTVNRRKVTITSADAEKEYDGEALTATSVTVTGPDGKEGFVGNDAEKVEYSFTGKQLLVGMSDNYFSYDLNREIAKNYEITTQNGTLNVTNRNAQYEVTLKANSDTVVWDGTEKSVEGFETTVFEIGSHEYTVSGITAAASATEPGVYQTSANGVAVVTDAEGNDVTEQFKVSVEQGTLTIKGVYTLTINYVNGAGRKVADSYVGKYVEGEQYGPIESPTIAGYTPSYKSISSGKNGMPARDLEVSVVYRANVTPTPTPENPTPTPTPVTPVPTPNPTPTPGETEEPGTGETVEDEEVPAGTIEIDENGNAVVTELDDEQVPLAAEEMTSTSWALINLIAAIVTALISLILLLAYFTGKKEEKEERETAEEMMSEDEEEKLRRKGLLRIFGLVPAIISVIMFVLTEDMTSKMAYTDKWTICMVLLLVIEVVVALFSKKKVEKTEKEAQN